MTRIRKKYVVNWTGVRGGDLSKKFFTRDGFASMPCLIVLLSLFFPRVFLIAIFICTNWLGRAYETVLWPVLGFIFMPFTTLAYCYAMLWNNHNVNGGFLVLVVFAVLLDLAQVFA